MQILLNPGPVNLSDRVRKALAGPDICHREVEFSELQTGIREKLLDVYSLDEHWAAILLTGSGTSAMEAMLTSLVGANEKILIIENGAYGERLSRIAAIHGLTYQTLHHEWGEKIDTDRLAKLLGDDIAYIAVIHHETTTGRLNDLAAIAAVARVYGTPLLVDGVSSFGAEEIRFEDWNIAACAGTANKCLHAIPGTAFVIVNRRYSKDLDANQRTLYLNLGTYLQQQDSGGTPFTQSVQSMYALNEALDEFREQGGWQQRRESYREKMAMIYRGLTEMGIQALITADESSCVLQSFLLPTGISYQHLHDELKRMGFVIYAGQGDLAKTLFRVSMMGAVTTGDAARFVDSVGKIITG